MKQWRLKHPEKDGIYYEKNKEHIAKKHKDWQLNNSEKFKFLQKRWQQEHRKEVNEYLKMWRRLNPEKEKAKYRHYRITHKAKLNEDEKRRYRTNPTYRQKTRIRSYARHHVNLTRCLICWKRTELSRHHYLGYKEKSFNEVIVLCREHHRRADYFDSIAKVS